MQAAPLSASILAVTVLTAGTALARDEIRIVGSSTVFPYTQAVAETFANVTGSPSPIVESTGTGGGMKIFCGGIGAQFPDITGASRAMKASEYALCQTNGVTDVSEALIGFDGLSMATSRASAHDWDLTLVDIYNALAAQTEVDGAWVDNPNRTWADVRADLPAVEILAYGPPPTSGTRDAFVELAMHEGCEQLPYVKAQKAALDKSAYKSFIKEYGKQETHGIVGGVMDETYYDASGVDAIGKLPSKQELYAKIAGSIKAVPTKLARVVKEPGSKLARAIKLAGEKQE